jgi:hypothetical protein
VRVFLNPFAKLFPLALSYIPCEIVIKVEVVE